ncbi:MAG: hypothetical protein ACKVKT_08525, partial [Rhodospirillales bacterium]
TTQALAIAEGAIAGLTALPGSLERFYGPHLGTAFDASKLHDGIDDGTWSQFEILNGYFKLHPSCAHLHGVNDAVDALIAEHEVTEANIVRVDISTFGEAMEIDTDTPTNDLAARFSAKATVAAALRYGSLNDEGLLDLNALAPLMEKITARHDPELDQYTPAGRPGVVTMGLTSGHKVTKEIIYPRGTAQTLATPDERKAKSLMLLTRHYGEEKAHGIHDTIMSLGNEGEIEALTSSLRA